MFMLCKILLKPTNSTKIQLFINIFILLYYIIYKYINTIYIVI